MLRNTSQSWGALAKLLHWLVAALIFVQLALGWTAVNWRLSPTKLELFVWHKSMGMLILVLMIVRIMWRWANPTPALPANVPMNERRAAQLSHGLLYLLAFLMPVTGWIVNSAANIPFRVFWLIPLPSIVEPDKATAEAAASVHLALFVMLSLLLAVHIGAALRHHFLKHDEVLVRMLPARGRAK
jgi:cytochrome b561